MMFLFLGVAAGILPEFSVIFLSLVTLHKPTAEFAPYPQHNPHLGHRFRSGNILQEWREKIRRIPFAEKVWSEVPDMFKCVCLRRVLNTSTRHKSRFLGHCGMCNGLVWIELSWSCSASSFPRTHGWGDSCTETTKKDAGRYSAHQILDKILHDLLLDLTTNESSVANSSVPFLSSLMFSTSQVDWKWVNLKSAATEIRNIPT
jgi:hypothetical protein